jgi:hypothetical protein
MRAPLTVILDQHRARYPLLEAVDIYKLIHQGVFGPGHIVSSAEAARRAIEDEVRRQKSEGRMQGETESAVEEIDPDGWFVRVNLRPLCAGPGFDTARLAAVLFESAGTPVGDAAQMRQRLLDATGWCAVALPGAAVLLDEIARAAVPAGWSPRHHSEAYRRAYRPAYRVARRDLFEASGLL